ncbi:hypothetical protein [Brevundimonas sp. NIBR11]|uniref:hypothetical protein n=1 Tax=Brevundimonas sp. NIBR11 TaxID=3015999 RepID=UPI0022F05143|nr:hypothetical protein [Brevundimonas sp. NIBR11]WGM31624.1 hypothetical protein KKHFBJBL_01871 [Brevundimonas sp. NIBR11]
MAAKLKVFTWSDGFHAFTVAASSRPKALEAWGASQDLFKTGLAHEVTEGADRDAALASPGAVISRGLSVDVGKAETRKPRPSNAKAKAKLKALEAELDTLDAEQAMAVQSINDRMAALEVERTRLAADHDKARKAMLAKVKMARSSVSS